MLLDDFGKQSFYGSFVGDVASVRGHFDAREIFLDLIARFASRIGVQVDDRNIRAVVCGDVGRGASQARSCAGAAIECTLEVDRVPKVEKREANTTMVRPAKSSRSEVILTAAIVAVSVCLRGVEQCADLR